MCSESEPSPPLMAVTTQQRNSDPPPNPLAVQPFSLRKMSCNGCRVLRKGCSDDCVLRQSLQWIESPQSQANATVFVAKFFGRAGLMTFIQGVYETERPALFKSLLYEACGRTINPVHGAVGLLWTGKWHICQAAVQKVLNGGNLERPPTPTNFPSNDTNRAIVSISPSTDTNGAAAAPSFSSVGANKAIVLSLPLRDSNGVAVPNFSSIDGNKATGSNLPPRNTYGVAVPSLPSIDANKTTVPTLPPIDTSGVAVPSFSSIDGNKAIVPTLPSSDAYALAMPIFSSIDAVESRPQEGNTSQEKFDIHRRTGIPEFSVLDNQGACKRPTDDDLSKLYELGKAVTTVNRRVRQRTEEGNNIAVANIDGSNIAGNNDAIQNIGQVINDGNLTGGNINAADVTSTTGSGQQQNAGGDVKLDLSLNCQSKLSNLKQQRISSPSGNSVNSEGSVNRQLPGPLPESPQKLLDLL
ncbi:hypothetical protein SUGI_0231990 [Cryptomeria japonica]|uniref:uncharacterized protein LOC131075445 n=1 Tax=Cryptomeria japonica TaxID=3369 RepID=UPI002408C5FA|nr:uncharacterized protein LOC131075445 [Cryptomeria japonica]GLJ14359.1 hypothetical protein SUGI_0231990 [Cryptomeria japonica]